MHHKVLFVDDESHILDGLRRLLHQEGYEILTATSGAEALAILEETSVDVVVSDQEMPMMTGVELLSKVKEHYPDIARFIFTGKATLDIAIEAINKGAISHFFTKPCREVSLRYTIRQALEYKDLIVEAKRLLKTVKQQKVLLEELEEKTPGISRLNRDQDGALLISEDSISSNQLLKEIRRELGGK